LSPTSQCHARTKIPSRGPYGWIITTGAGATAATATGSGAGGGAGVLGTIVVTAGCGGGGALVSSSTAIASMSTFGSTAIWWLITEFSGRPASSSRTRRIS
jgi:hypothetical protein